MKILDFKVIDAKWQKYWEEHGVNLQQTDLQTGQKKFYILDMFPYPSGAGLHVGHPKGYIATDVYSRLKKMQGFQILHPMGFDAFGLPAEQYALKNKIHPRVAVEKNVARYKKQLQILGLNYDWSREINTTDTNYYKWTQWMFKQMYKKGLARESNEPINWCPTCKTGLANEDLKDGNLCERCDSVVEKRKIRQWVVKITDYADRLLGGLEKLDWEPHIKKLQEDWIGKSEGSEIAFEIVDWEDYNLPENKLNIFTTRADTLYGCTFMAISWQLAKEWIENGWEASEEIKAMIDKFNREENDRGIDFDMSKLPKEGIDTGITAINPANSETVPIYIANYVLSDYGTGALMAVPAHDERDFEFANKYGIPLKQVVRPENRYKAVVVRETFQSPEKFVEDLKKYNFNYKISKSKISKREHVCLELKKSQLEKFIELVQSQLTDHNWVEVLGSKNLVILKDEVHEDLLDKADEWFKKFSEWEPHVRGQKNFWDMLNKNEFLSEFIHFTGYGILNNSKEFDGTNSEKAKVEITKAVGGKMVSQYKLKDWVFARQRYWGEPFPIVWDENHQSYAVVDSELPVRLPEVENYEPTDTGESPLANIRDWVEVYGYINNEGEFESCEKSDERAQKFTRETNTMPQWAGSSWYWMRYLDPKNSEQFVAKNLEKIWDPVDFYVGGAEHATRHLIYARFWYKFLFDIGCVNYDEPFQKLKTVGLILAEDGQKMSKRYGNTVNPDEIVEQYGADTLRAYEMFMGPFEKAIAWNTNGLIGMSRFLDRVYNLALAASENFANKDTEEVERELNLAIKKVGSDIENFKFNTAISQLMICLNVLEDKIKKGEQISKQSIRKYTQILAPFAVHLSEEIWQEILGEKFSIHESLWPKYDEAKITESEVEIAIQISGKFRGTFAAVADVSDQDLENLVRESETFQKYVPDPAQIKKIIIVKNRLVNIVI